ncbi:MAG: MoxR-like ATPase [Myxococcota bacterium]|jgi:MoxR-like ATPase
MDNDVALFEALAPTRQALLDSIGKVVVGQQHVVDLMLTALFANGHCLFVGVPGLAKTLLVNTVAKAVGVQHGRIQFTPDLMPADITGSEILEEDKVSGARKLRFVKGPIFSNLLLADEINRTPPKTQAALLQAMQEREVTAAGRTYPLDKPFLVFATQNPIEQEGTYPLPEAQQDRFMFSINVGYPTMPEEEEIVRRTTVGTMPKATQVLDRDRLLALQGVLGRLPANPDVVKYAVKLATMTRPEHKSGAAKWIRWGAGPRASQYLAIGARSWAALRGHEVATIDDVKAIASAVLSHRIVLNFEAEAAGLTPHTVVAQLIEELG